MNPYTHIRHAIAYVEFFACQPMDGDPETTWDWLMSLPTSLPNMIKTFQQTLDESIAEGDMPPSLEMQRLVRAEMDHPEFRTYIAGKMGMF